MLDQNPASRSRTNLRITFTSMLLALVCTGFLYLAPGLTESLDLKFYDFKMGIRGPGKISPDIVHVDIDDLAIQRFGMWPWDRSLSGWIVKRLNHLGARAIAFDVLYTTPGKSQEGNEIFFRSIKDSKKFVAATAFRVTDRMQDKIAFALDDGRARELYERAWPLLAPENYNLFHLKSLENSLVPLSTILSNAAQVGHIKDVPDRDGVYRRVPLFVAFNDRLVPGLGVATFSVFSGTAPTDISLGKSFEVNVRWKGREIRVPVDDNCRMLINWGNIWRSFPHYSVVDLLENEPDEVKAQSYRDKIVIVGVTASGATDLGISPLHSRTPLSRVHSHAMNTILTGEFITSIPLFPFPVAIALLTTLLFVTAVGRASLRTMILVILIVIVIGVVSIVTLFTFFSYEISLFGPLLIFLPATLASVAHRTVSTELEAYRTSKALERYLSTDIVREIVEKGEEVDLRTKKRDLTIMFVDIKGFSTMSEEVDAETVNRYLNDFFEIMTCSVFEQKGTVDKFLGDGLLAFFGDPVPLENHARAALDAAVSMQKRMSELNAMWIHSGVEQLSKGMSIRIGINSGNVIVGNIGSRHRLEYTVLGPVVNIASRLQSLAPPGGIIMSKDTWEAAGMVIKSQGPDTVKVKGIERGIQVFTILPENI